MALNAQAYHDGEDKQEGRRIALGHRAALLNQLPLLRHGRPLHLRGHRASRRSRLGIDRHVDDARPWRIAESRGGQGSANVSLVRFRSDRPLRLPVSPAQAHSLRCPLRSLPLHGRLVRERHSAL